MGGALPTWCLGVRGGDFFPLAGRGSKLGESSRELTTLCHFNAHQYLTHRTRGVTSKHRARLVNLSFAFGPSIILEPARTLLLGHWTISLFCFFLWTSDYILPLNFGLHLFSIFVWDHGLFLVFTCIWTLHYLCHVSSASRPGFSSLFSCFRIIHIKSLRTFLFLRQRRCSVASFLRLLFVSVLYFSDSWRWEGGRVMSTLGDIFCYKHCPPPPAPCVSFPC